ncbi:hypothetical protein C8R45DRAFT_932996 [Mycena sanguinolenta]|nr:hypothetical protein C8R45DRAFT_932996 [Mycena sanguinolenta]
MGPVTTSTRPGLRWRVAEDLRSNTYFDLNSAEDASPSTTPISNTPPDPTNPSRPVNPSSPADLSAPANPSPLQQGMLRFDNGPPGVERPFKKSQMDAEPSAEPQNECRWARRMVAKYESAYKKSEEELKHGALLYRPRNRSSTPPLRTAHAASFNGVTRLRIQQDSVSACEISEKSPPFSAGAEVQSSYTGTELKNLGDAEFRGLESMILEGDPLHGVGFLHDPGQRQ